MATLQRIRNHGGLLVGIIFVALAAFLLGDAFRSGAFGNDTQVVGEIDGNKINIIDFQSKVDEISEVHKMSTGNMQLDEQAMIQVRNEVWRDYEYLMIMEPACKSLGLAVTADELFDMVQGSNVHPAIQQMFTDPQTGQFNRSAILNFLRALDAGQVDQQQYLYWNYLEKQIKRDRLVSKYNVLVGKGMYVTSLEAKNSLNEKNTTVSFNYVKLPYSLIADSTVNVSNSDVKAYYNAHKEEYKQESARNIEYVTLPIIATEEDKAETLAWIQEIRDEFATASDNRQFVNINSDLSFDGNYLKEQDVEENLREFAFTGNVGDVFGPIEEGNAYKLVKIDSRASLPDSVEARHILINPQTLGSLEAANALADSLKTLLEKDSKASFADLAQRYSEDTGSASKGGNLGWFKRNQMVKSFEDAAFNGDLKKYYIVTSQFGVHLIQTTNKGVAVQQVRLAELVRNIEPSAHTEDAVYASASKLVTQKDADNFSNEVKELGLNVRRATITEDQTSIAGLEDSRSLVRAAYKAEAEGELLADYEGTSIFKFGNSFVIAHLTGIQEKGYASLASMEPSLRREVIKDKKAEMLAAKVSGSDLNAIAANANASVLSEQNANFGMYMLPTLGVEPAVLGTAVSLPEGKVSKAVKGNAGIYVLQNTMVNKASAPADYAVYAEQAQLNAAYAYRVNYQSFEVLKEKVTIEDNRVRFY